MKKINLGWLLLVAILVSGCGNRQTASKQSGKSSTSVETVKKTPAAKKASKSSSKQVIGSAVKSSHKQVTTKKTASQQETMNLSEIKKGVYSSLLGEWQEVATRINYSNEKGDVWEAPNPKDQLTITNSRLSDTRYTLEGTTLGEKGDASANETVSMSERNGSLGVYGDLDAMAISIDFYPKGIRLSDWGNDVPDTIKSNTERIIIRTSNNSYSEVFERQTSVTNAQPAQQTMNLSTILTGDYTSLSGTWRNGNGASIKVQGQQMQFSDFGVRKSATPGTITGLKMNVPSWNNVNGTPKKVVGHTGAVAPKYQKELRGTTTDGESKLVGAISSDGALYEVLFMPSGKNADLHNGDSSKERIVIGGTQNDLAEMDANKVYYRVQ